MTDTWKLVPVTDEPILGEVRFTRQCFPYDQGAIVMWQQVVWTGKEWIVHGFPFFGVGA